MTKTYTSYDALTDEIMWAINDAVEGSEIGVSARSISRYVELNERRVRISDHEARASCGGNIVFEIDTRDFGIEEIYDDCNEFDGIEVAHDWKIADAIDAAIKALTA